MTKESLTAKFAYRIEPKLGGGFVARSTDPSMPVFEGATAEELKQQIQAKILEAIGARLGSVFHMGDGIKLNVNSVELRSTQQPNQTSSTVWATSSSSGRPLSLNTPKLKQRMSAIIAALLMAAVMLLWLMHR
jgi:hypothetical protein